MTRKLLKCHGVEIAVIDPIRWLLSQNEGVFLLHLLGKNNLLNQSNDNVIFVDVCAREILDYVEKFPMNLSNDAISSCMGDEFFLEEVLELRRIEKQPKKSSGGGKGGSRSTDKRKEQ